MKILVYSLSEVYYANYMYVTLVLIVILQLLAQTQLAQLLFTTATELLLANTYQEQIILSNSLLMTL